MNWITSHVTHQALHFKARHTQGFQVENRNTCTLLSFTCCFPLMPNQIVSNHAMNCWDNRYIAKIFNKLLAEGKPVRFVEFTEEEKGPWVPKRPKVAPCSPRKRRGAQCGRAQSGYLFNARPCWSTQRNSACVKVTSPPPPLSTAGWDSVPLLSTASRKNARRD